LIFVAFFLPLAIYLLVLGHINRRHRPVLMSGAWDVIGILFAASGFLLVGGPSILSSLNERWRMYWVLGQGGSSSTSPGGGYQLWVFLSFLYILVVVVGSGFLFWRQRRVTSIYNVDLRTLEPMLTDICAELGLTPTRSGNLFVFGLSQPILAGLGRRSLQGIQASSPLTRAKPDPGLAAAELRNQTAVLEVDAFPLMHHISLRWDPPGDSPLRREIETELTRRLSNTLAPEHDTSAWLTIAGLLLLALTLLGALALILYRMFVR
jgi:hypothetical protein